MVSLHRTRLGAVQQLLQALPLNIDNLPVEGPKTGFGEPLKERVVVLELEQEVLNFGVEIEQPCVGCDGRAGNAATAGQIDLGVGQPGVEQLLVSPSPRRR